MGPCCGQGGQEPAPPKGFERKEQHEVLGTRRAPADGFGGQEPASTKKIQSLFPQITTRGFIEKTLATGEGACEMGKRLKTAGACGREGPTESFATEEVAKQTRQGKAKAARTAESKADQGGRTLAKRNTLQTYEIQWLHGWSSVDLILPGAKETKCQEFTDIDAKKVWIRQQCYIGLPFHQKPWFTMFGVDWYSFVLVGSMVTGTKFSQARHQVMTSQPWAWARRTPNRNKAHCGVSESPSSLKVETVVFFILWI